MTKLCQLPQMSQAPWGRRCPPCSSSQHLASHRRGAQCGGEDSQNKHSGCWDHMIPIDIISLILPLANNVPAQDQPGKKLSCIAPHATRDLYFSAGGVKHVTCTLEGILAGGLRTSLYSPDVNSSTETSS